MKSLLVCLFGFCIVSASSKSITSGGIEEEWKSFKIEYNKSYSDAEDKIRFKIFTDTKDRVDQHNKRFENNEISFKVGINNFADFTQDERATLTCDNSAFNLSSIPASYYYVRKNMANVPKKKDWRTEGAVTHVKSQAGCGSCWAFSATGALEGQHFLKTGKLVSLSEQNLVDCSWRFRNMGCKGGFTTKAFEYIVINNGIDTEQAYPYKGVHQKCKYNVNKKGATCRGYKVLETGNEALMEAIATIGPISVSIHGSLNSFQNYVGPHIYDDPQCRSDLLDHAVLAVGYGTDKNGRDYWIIKNSWGTKWGVDGYMKLARNTCGIGKMATFPVV